MLAIILVHLLFLGLIHAELYEGDPCIPDKYPNGVCKRIQECEEVYELLKSGILPQSNCGFIAFDPVVCCPIHDSVTPKLMQENITDVPGRSPIGEEVSERGSLARQKCAEYSRSVYTEVIPPTLTAYRKPVNVSLCAIKQKKLIVGGEKAEPKEFPHMALVGFNSKSDGIIWSCGGSLVSDLYVLSAAHCTSVVGLGAASWIRVGDLILGSDIDDARPVVRRIVERIRYPDYKKPSEYHDIALLKMEKPVPFNAWIRPACLPSYKEVQNIRTVIATGWGRVQWYEENGSQHLLKVTLPIVPVQRCSRSFPPGTDYKVKNGIIDKWQICAGAEGKDTCQGDSGGPLSIYDPQFSCMYDIIGVTSLGRLCGETTPGVYTRVINYITWLEDTIWGDNQL